MKFYLGSHDPRFLEWTDVPLFVSRRTIAKRKRLPVAIGRWALDSGGFSELNLYGKWETSPEQYIDEIFRLKEEVGNLDWVAPQDWMCEPIIIQKTKSNVFNHQLQTLYSFTKLRKELGNLVIPVLQGWQLKDYIYHIHMYKIFGIDLTKESTVGVGSVCRRQNTQEIGEIFHSLKDSGISTHGFGVKSQGIESYGKYLTSSDSLAWSYYARRLKILLDGCQGHINCANCLKFALKWREEKILRVVNNV